MSLPSINCHQWAKERVRGPWVEKRVRLLHAGSYSLGLAWWGHDIITPIGKRRHDQKGPLALGKKTVLKDLWREDRHGHQRTLWQQAWNLQMEGLTPLMQWASKRHTKNCLLLSLLHISAVEQHYHDWNGQSDAWAQALRIAVDHWLPRIQNSPHLIWINSTQIHYVFFGAQKYAQFLWPNLVQSYERNTALTSERGH